MIEWLVAVAVAGAVLVCIICGRKVTLEARLLNSGFVRSHPEPENQPELTSNQLTIEWVNPYHSVYRSTGPTPGAGLPAEREPKLPSYHEALDM